MAIARLYKTVYVFCAHLPGSLFVPTAAILLRTYGWKGSIWIISGIILNGVACGLVFRPLELNRVKRKRHESDPKEPIQKGIIMTKIIEQKKRHRQESHRSLDGALITSDNELIRNKEEVERIMNNYERQTGAQLQPVAEQLEEATVDAANASTPNLNGSTGVRGPQVSSNTGSDVLSKSSLELSTAQSKPMHKQLMRLKSVENGTRQRSTSLNFDSSERTATQSNDALHASRENIRQREALRPMNRADIFYSGSVTNIPEYTASGNMQNYVHSFVSIPDVPDDADPDSCSTKCMPLVSVLKSMLDFSLLKSPTFSLLCVASVLAMTGL